jgi:DNA-binding transcriptional ArsR family regulator
MRDVVYIDDIDRAASLLKPMRVQLLRLLIEPQSLAELATITGETPQKLYYHVKTLERAGLVQRVAERRAGAMVEGVYQSTARSYWLAPQVVGQAGGEQRARDDFSLGFLLGLAEEMQQDLGRLTARALVHDVPSLGLDLRVYLAPEQRDGFASDVQQMFQDIAVKYGIQDEASGETFRVVLACYPDEQVDSDDAGS